MPDDPSEKERLIDLLVLHPQHVPLLQAERAPNPGDVNAVQQQHLNHHRRVELRERQRPTDPCGLELASDRHPSWCSTPLHPSVTADHATGF